MKTTKTMLILITATAAGVLSWGAGNLRASTPESKPQPATTEKAGAEKAGEKAPAADGKTTVAVATRPAALHEEPEAVTEPSKAEPAKADPAKPAPDAASTASEYANLNTQLVAVSDALERFNRKLMERITKQSGKAGFQGQATPAQPTTQPAPQPAPQAAKPVPAPTK